MVILKDVLEFINRPYMTTEERRAIVEAVNTQSRAVRADAKAQLRTGMRVTFLSTRAGREVVGRIVKVNRVNIELVEDGNQMRWRVSPSLVHKVL